MDWDETNKGYRVVDLFRSAHRCGFTAFGWSQGPSRLLCRRGSGWRAARDKMAGGGFTICRRLTTCWQERVALPDRDENWVRAGRHNQTARRSVSDSGGRINNPPQATSLHHKGLGTRLSGGSFRECITKAVARMLAIGLGTQRSGRLAGQPRRGRGVFEGTPQRTPTRKLANRR
jgi:hypothetical protein